MTTMPLRHSLSNLLGILLIAVTVRATPCPVADLAGMEPISRPTVLCHFKPEKTNSTPAKASAPFALEPSDKCVWIDIHAFVDELESGGKLKADEADTLRRQYIDTKDERIAYRFHAAKRQATENSTKTAAIDSFLRHVRSLLTAQ